MMRELHLLGKIDYSNWIKDKIRLKEKLLD
jgi:hypothetical protein